MRRVSHRPTSVHLERPKPAAPEPVVAVTPPPVAKRLVDEVVAAARSLLSPAVPSRTSLAEQLHDAFGWLRLPPGPSVPDVMQALGGKTPSELKQLRADYLAKYGVELTSAARRALGPLYARVAPLLKGTSPAASALGDAVARAAWASDHALGTVPDDDLYTTKNAVDGIYVDAKEIFPAIADQIASAKHEVDFETFEWDPSRFSKNEPGWRSDPTMQVMDGLSRLQQRLESEQAAGENPEVPVRIYLAIDGPERGSAGNWGVDKVRNLYRQLDALGLDSALVEVHVAVHERKVWGAAHSKLLVVDGYRAMVMGANPQRFQTLTSSWHDLGYAVRGEAGIGLRHSFDVTWSESQEVTSMNVEKLDGHAETTTRPTTPIAHVAAVDEPDLDTDAALKNAELPMFLPTHRSYDLRQGLPTSVRSPQNQAFIAMLHNARGTVKIETPNLNDARVKQEILDAVNRGVTVEVVLSLGFNSGAERQTLLDQLGPTGARLPQALRVELSKVNSGGSNEDVLVELFGKLTDPSARQRLQIKWNSADGRRPTFGQEPGATHAKYMTADGQVAIVGSANMDFASWILAYETNVMVDSKQATADLDRRIFDPDFARGVDVIDWAKGIRDGAVPVTAELDALLGGDARGYAEHLIALYSR